MDWITGILLKMTFSVGLQQARKYHCTGIHSLSSFSLPCKKEGFTLTALCLGFPGARGKTPTPTTEAREAKLSYRTENRVREEGKGGGLAIQAACHGKFLLWLRVGRRVRFREVAAICVEVLRMAEMGSNGF